MANFKISGLILCFILIITFGAVPSRAAIYTVGDSSGWALGVDYSTWSQDKAFKVGDKLEFLYDAIKHTVEEVSASDYMACSSANPISSAYDVGDTVVELKTAGTHYFISHVDDDCVSGMKLAVSVAAASSIPLTGFL